MPYLYILKEEETDTVLPFLVSQFAWYFGKVQTNEVCYIFKWTPGIPLSKYCWRTTAYWLHYGRLVLRENTSKSYAFLLMHEKFYVLKRTSVPKYAIARQHSSHWLGAGLLQVPTLICTPNVTSEVTAMTGTHSVWLWSELSRLWSA